MKVNSSVSANIIRDENLELDYKVTRNTELAAFRILTDFEKGFHSFNIIGSYGTGKSSFLLAFQQSLQGKKQHFEVKKPKGIKEISFINIVGEYSSLNETLCQYFDIKTDYKSHQKLFDAIYTKLQSLGKGGMLFLVIDEFGKHLEYAAKNNPEKEMYFIQQLSEFINHSDRNIVLLTSVHQSINSYSNELTLAQKNEWQKVNGRFTDIVFNEPVEHLLNLTALHFGSSKDSQNQENYIASVITSLKGNNIFGSDFSLEITTASNLAPLDPVSSVILAKSLQRYGQNERSLFTFFKAISNTKFDVSEVFTVQNVYDYLFDNFYTQLVSKYNQDYNAWSEIRDSIHRIRTVKIDHSKIAEDLIKTIGLLNLFKIAGGSINEEFLQAYYQDQYDGKAVTLTLNQLVGFKMLVWTNYDSCYKLFQGTDLDINAALIKAENQIDAVDDILPRVSSLINFPPIMAKAHSYRTGTPRFFDFEVSSKPIEKKAKGEVDGYINLLFSDKIKSDSLIELSKEAPTLYGVFEDTEQIRVALKDIDKTKKVLKDVSEDKVAAKELNLILESNQRLLNHFLHNGLFNGSVIWYLLGEKVNISNQRDLNKKLTIVCDSFYTDTPVIKNELINRHKISGAISSARRTYFNSLSDNWGSEDLGFDKEKFPPEKTIYYTLLKNSGVHSKTSIGFELKEPNTDSAIFSLWQVCSDFLDDTKKEQRSIQDLFNIFLEAPYQLKTGLLEFWIPTFLFIRRGDYALYDNGVYKPQINGQIMNLIMRNPESYTIRAFQLNDLRINFFNKYRELLNQSVTQQIDVKSFIESISPILITYKNLNAYSKSTKKLSKEALNVREAIRQAKDPDTIFFEGFPTALGYDPAELINSEQKFDLYINDFQNSLLEIENAYNTLLGRFELFIIEEFLDGKPSFSSYKKTFEDRFASLKEHQLIKKQTIFIQRVKSPLNDRDSWLASISQILLGKRLEDATDLDESVLKEEFRQMVKSLDNLAELHSLNANEDKENIIKIDVTTTSSGLKQQISRISKKRLTELETTMSSIKKDLGSDKQLRIAILAELLKQELDND